MSLLNSVLENTTTVRFNDMAEKGRLVYMQADKGGKGIETSQNNAVFTVETLPISSEYSIIPKKKGLFVEKKCINIVSDSYKVHQPSEVIQTFKDVTAEIGLEVNRIITNKTNGGLLLSASYNDNVKILGEKHNANLVFYTSHCGKHKTFLSLDLMRLACFNQVPTLAANKKRHIISEKHYQNALSMTCLQKVLAKIPAMIADYNEKASTLIDKKLSFDDFLNLWIEKEKLQHTAKSYDRKINKLRETYYNAPGQKQLTDSAYKAYQTVTYLNTHEIRDTPNKEETRHITNANNSIEYLFELLEA